MLKKRFLLNNPSFSYTILPILTTFIAFIVYLQLAWQILSPQAVWSVDTGAKLLQLQNLRVENGRLQHDIAYPGQKIDPDFQFAHWGFVEISQGKMQFSRLPIFPIITLPFFQMFGMYGLYILPALCGALLGGLTLALLKPTDRRLAMWVLIAFGSPVIIYAANFWEHTLASSLAIGAAWLAIKLGPTPLKANPSKIAGWVGVGILLALATFIRLETIFFVIALFFACWWVMKEGRWGPVWAISPLIIGGIIYIPLHLLILGHTLPDHSQYLFYPLAYLKATGWYSIPSFLIGPVVDTAIQIGIGGVVWAIAAVLALICSLRPQSTLISNLGLLFLSLTAIIAALFLFTTKPYQTAHGFLFTTPWAILGLYRAYEVWQNGDWRAKIVVLTTILGLLGYIIGLVGLRGASPNGGLEWGMRFAMTFYPLLALIAAWDLGKKQKDIKTLIVVAALIFLGIGFQLRGLSVIQQSKQANQNLNERIVEIPEQYIVSDVRWISLNAAPIYYQKTIFTTSTPEELKEWVLLAVTQQVKQFAVITFNGQLPGLVNQELNNYKLKTIETSRAGALVIFRLQIESKQ